MHNNTKMTKLVFKLGLTSGEMMNVIQNCFANSKLKRLLAKDDYAMLIQNQFHKQIALQFAWILSIGQQHIILCWHPFLFLMSLVKEFQLHGCWQIMMTPLHMRLFFWNFKENLWSVNHTLAYVGHGQPIL